MITVLMDDSRLEGTGSLLFQQPVDVIRATTRADVPAALARLEAGVAGGQHAAGWMAYELGLALEPRLSPLLPPADDRHPLLEFGLFPPPRQLSTLEVDLWLAKQTGGDAAPSFREPPSPVWTEADYLRRFRRAAAAIAAGDIYQMNLTVEARFGLNGSPLGLYRLLRQRQRVAHGALIIRPGETILSLSPELFLTQNGRTVLTRPMKGTAARAPTLDGDATVRLELAADAKQRAENLMIVDLMRNDLSRVAEIGSVKVPDLFTVETLRTLHQMTSGVTGTLRTEVNFPALMRATFPAGSITGAPKIRAMQIISELEQRRRGPYCGSIGHIAPATASAPRRAWFNVGIRTMTIDADGNGSIGVGSGLVADSHGPAEYAECLLKMRFLTHPQPAFALFETMRLAADGTVPLLERHLARLKASAAWFAFWHDPASITEAIADAAKGHRGTERRLRLELAEDGAVTVTTAAMPSVVERWRYRVADVRTHSSDVFLHHKTTHRPVYAAARATLPPGVDEVLFLNERGEVTEGAITSVFVERGSRLVTPPLSAGVLPGVLRAELLATGRAVEGTVTPADLAAGTVWLGNALRGLAPAVAAALT